MAVPGANEVLRGLADKGPRNHAPDAVLVDELAGDEAQVDEALEAERLLVTGDLEHAVRRGIDDRLARTYVLFPKLCDDLRARRVAVPEHARELPLRDQPLAPHRRKRIGC